MRYLIVLMFMVMSLDAFSAETKPNDNKIKVVATFSILADITEQIGGDLVEVESLIAWDQDAHTFHASPKDIKVMQGADILVVNGLGFEAWLYRLIEVSGFSGLTAIATQGVDVLSVDSFHRDHDHARDHHGHHDEHHADDTQAFMADPHAWHSIEAGKLYIANIRDALIQTLPEHKVAINQRASDYIEQLNLLQSEMAALIENIPEASRNVLVPHDAFAYLARDFGINFHSVYGVSTDSDISAADLARIVRKIKTTNVRAIYAENVSNNKLINQVMRETGVKYGGRLISGALSAEIAPTYIDLIRYNLTLLVEGIR